MVGLSAEIRAPKTNGGLKSWFTKCAISPDGATVVAGVAQTRGTTTTTHLHIFDASSGLERLSIRCGRTDSYAVKEGDGAVLALRFSTDGRWLLVSHEGETAESARTTCRGRAVLYDASADFRRLRVVGEHPEKIMDVAFSPDGRYAGTAGQDSRGGIWPLDAQEPDVQATWLDGHTSNVRSIDFSHDSVLVATASHDCTCRVYKVAGGTCVATLRGHDHWVYRVGFSPFEWKLATASADASVSVWKLAEGRAEGMDAFKMHCAKQAGAVRDLAWHKDGFFATSSDSSSILMFDFANGKKLQEITFSGPKLSKASRDQGLSLMWADDVLMCSSTEAVQLWDLNGKRRSSTPLWLLALVLIGCFIEMLRMNSNSFSGYWMHGISHHKLNSTM